jgi:hypothetical protein
MERPQCGLCKRTASLCEFPTKRKRSSISGKKRNVISKLDEHHLNLLARLLEENPSLLKTTSPPQVNPLPQDDAVQSTSPSQEEEQSTSPNVQSSAVHISSPSLDQYEEAQYHISRVNEGYATPRRTTEQPSTVSHALAVHLIEIYFSTIATWLPLLHKPRFLERCHCTLTPGDDALANLSSEDRLILLGMFSLAARHSPLEQYWAGPLYERGQKFAQEAKEIYPRAGSSLQPSLQYLQGCLILAYYFHTSGLSPQGSILVGICVQLAIDLDLPRLDDDDVLSDLQLSPSEKEEHRRAWWAVWDLDTFGSILLMRPFAIDQRHVSVKLPISDENWFAGNHVESEVLHPNKEIDWASLCSSPNQDTRAWYLVTNIFLARVHDRLLLRQPLSTEEGAILENELGCLRLSLPPVSRLRTYTECDQDTICSNWIVGSHLLLSATAFMIRVLQSVGQTSSPKDEHGESSSQASHVLETTAILRMWPPDCIPTAHPFWAHAICPLFAFPSLDITDPPIYQSCRNLSDLVLKRFAERWELGRLALRMSFQDYLISES